MKLVCHIGDLEELFDIVQGATFSEDYNETLDSGNIIIVSRNKQLDIKPYDDVIIFDKDIESTYKGWGPTVIYNGFYRHLLVDNFSEEMIYQGAIDNINTVDFKYKISLFSETKKLEKIIVPRLSITQPLKNNNKKYIIEYLNNYLNLYNPQIKKTTNFHEMFPNVFIWEGNWKYEGKYSFYTIDITVNTHAELNGLSRLPYKTIVRVLNDENRDGKDSVYMNMSDLEIINVFNCMGDYKGDDLEVFKTIWSPEFTLGESNLRELLTELFQVTDRIPYVKDDIIYALDISKTKGEFDTNVGKLNFPVRSMTSADYCTNLRTTYSDALPQEYSGHSVEYVGFKNSDEAVLTLDNMRVELSFPIYKINHVYMHYYKSATFTIVDRTQPEGQQNTRVVDFPVLITQDITPFIKMNNEPLSKDWKKFLNSSSFSSIESFAKYDFCAVKYTQGSKYITGWGEKYQYPVGDWFDPQTGTHIENILRIVDHFHHYGNKTLYQIKRILENDVYNFQNGETIDSIDIEYLEYSQGNQENPNYLQTIMKSLFGTYDGLNPGGAGDFENYTDVLKEMFFTIDYQPFYNGAVVHSKGYSDVNEHLTSIDNPNNSLCLLERDGVAQREKLERFGVQAMQLNARYTSVDQLQKVGTTYNSPYTGDIVRFADDKDKVIIYHREYSIFDNVVNCSYYGSQEYVLKNYYTSVFSKYRVYNLMSYGESVRRAENEKFYIYLSLNKNGIKSDIDSDTNVKLNFGNFKPLWLSGIFPSLMQSNEEILSVYEKKFNGAYVFVNKYRTWVSNNSFFRTNEEGGYFAVDYMAFASDNFLVFNLSMIDNIIGGTYWEKINPQITWVDDVEDDLKGNVQNQYYIANYDDGTIYNMKFGFAHIKDLAKTSTSKDKYTHYTYTKNNTTYTIKGHINMEKIKKRPLIDSSEIDSYIEIEKEYNKDNKELIDFSLQFEYLCGDNIFISPWFTRLNDLVTNFYKQQTEEYIDELSVVNTENIFVRVGYEYSNGAGKNLGAIEHDETFVDYPGLEGFGHDYSVRPTPVSGVGSGFFAMTPDFYRGIAGVNWNDGNIVGAGGDNGKYTFSNPIITFGIIDTKFEPGSTNEVYDIDFNSGTITINNEMYQNGSPNYTQYRSCGNPYYRGTNNNVDFVKQLKITPKKIHITKDSDNSNQIDCDNKTTSEFLGPYQRETIYIKSSECHYFYERLINSGAEECEFGGTLFLDITDCAYLSLILNRFNGMAPFNMEVISLMMRLKTTLLHNGDNIEFDHDGFTVQDSVVKTFNGQNYDIYSFDSYTEYFKDKYLGNVENDDKYQCLHLYSFEEEWYDENDNRQEAKTWYILCFDNVINSDGTIYTVGNDIARRRYGLLPDISLYNYVKQNPKITHYHPEVGDYSDVFITRRSDGIFYYNSVPTNVTNTGTITDYFYSNIVYNFVSSDNFKNYVIVDIEYTTHKGNTGTVTGKKMLLNQAKYNNNSVKIDNYYLFTASLRYIENFNPLQLDLRPGAETNEYVISSTDETLQNNGYDVDNLDSWEDEIIEEEDDVVGNRPTHRVQKTTGYPKMMIDAMMNGITNPTINNHFVSSGTESEFYTITQGFDGGIDNYEIADMSRNLKDNLYADIQSLYQNLYYVLSTKELDKTSQYRIYSLSDSDIIDVSSPLITTVSTNEKGTASIDIIGVENSNNYKSFIVFYRSNDNLGIWDSNTGEYEDDTNLHFVFGVNIKSFMRNGNDFHINITPTLLKSRDRRIYGRDNTLKGKIDD